VKKAVWILCGLFLFSALVTAAEPARYEVFGGYSYQRMDEENYPAGWNASIAGYFTDNIGLVADFSGFYKTIPEGYWTGMSVVPAEVSIRNHYFLFGPQFAFHPNGRWTPFLRGLVGAVNSRMEMEVAGIADSSTDFAFGLGGGLDVAVGNSIDLRVIQCDYIRLEGEGHAAGNAFRISVGVVFKAR